MNSSASHSRAFVGRLEALADTTRLRLLRLLERQELGVVELCEVLQLPQSTVSRHLKLLSEQGWASNRRKGTSNLYRMDARELSATVRQLWSAARDETSHWPSARQDDLRLARHLELRRERSRSFFAGAAANWDALRSRLYGDRFTVAALTALLPRTLTIADLGCGTGYLVEQLAPYVRLVIGVDESDAMLAAARQRLVGAAGVELREGALESLPIAASTCDAALLVLTLTYVSDLPIVLQEVRRILLPSGKVVIVDLLAHEREDFRHEMGQHRLGFAAAELEDELVRAGFASMNFQPLSPEPDAKGPALFLATADRSSA